MRDLYFNAVPEWRCLLTGVRKHETRIPGSVAEGIYRTVWGWRFYSDSLVWEREEAVCTPPKKPHTFLYSIILWHYLECQIVRDLSLELLTLEDGTDSLSRDVGEELSLNAAQYPRRAQIRYFVSRSRTWLQNNCLVTCSLTLLQASFMHEQTFMFSRGNSIMTYQILFLPSIMENCRYRMNSH
jgi:hypothetical protein